MLQIFKNAWRTKDIRSKLIFTAIILLIYRIGTVIPVPFVDAHGFTGQFNGTILDQMNILSGGSLAAATLFALGVQPYINASIIMQLLAVAFPRLGELSKDEQGKKLMNMITRIVTVGLALVTAIGYYFLLKRGNLLAPVATKAGISQWICGAVIVACYCAGASLIMWLGERINEKGIGNGISIILFAGIIARLPAMLGSLISRCYTNKWSWGFITKSENWRLIQYPIGTVFFLLFVAILVACVIAVVWFSNSERRIPVQYAKRVVGRKMYGGQSSTLPIKLDMAGVMPVIFASSIASILPTIAGFIPDSGFGKFVNNYLGHTSFPYIAFQIILIIAFAYFYIMISFNPVEVSNNLRNNGGAIPGIRPGKPTVDYIKKILNRITLMGAIFLCGLSGIPMIVNAIWYAIDGQGISDLAFSGTSLLIVVGVALETFRELEAQMTLRNYKGFLD